MNHTTKPIRLNVRLGDFQFEYEGGEEFLKEELPTILSAMKDVGARRSIPSTSAAQAMLPEHESPAPAPNVSADLGTINNIGAVIGTSTGPELLISACVYLTFSRLKDRFSRQDVLNAMKESRDYKTTDRGNLTSMLMSAVKSKKINEVAKETYCLSSATRDEMGRRLAGN